MSGMNLLIWGDTESSPELRHEVPVDTGDPFLYLESDGRRAWSSPTRSGARIAGAAPDLERLLIDELGRDQGGVRVEDLLVVTEQGAESLTGSFPYDLTP